MAGNLQKEIDMTNTVLILGASGKIGRHTVRAFRDAGWDIRLYDRAKGDMVKSAMGVDVIVNGLNPPNYQNWAQNIPAITEQVIAAAKASGATVIIPGNVYNFGDQPGEWSETTAQNPVSEKGVIRKEMERSYRDSGVQTIILRAGNFIGDAADDDVMRVMILRTIKKGKITAPGGADVMQTYCYLPDWARAVVMLTGKRERLAAFEDVPFPGHSFTLTDLHRVLEQELGRPLKVTKFPWLVMTLLAPFWELASELKEMRYLWNTPHTMSAKKLNRLLPEFQPTPMRQVMTAGLLTDIYPHKCMSGTAPLVLSQQ